MGIAVNAHEFRSPSAARAGVTRAEEGYSTRHVAAAKGHMVYDTHCNDPGLNRAGCFH